MKNSDDLRHVLERLLSTAEAKHAGVRYSEYYKEMIDLTPLSSKGAEESRHREANAANSAG